MSDREAIMYLEYIRENWTEKNSPYWNALTRGIEAIKSICDVRSCLGNKEESNDA